MKARLRRSWPARVTALGFIINIVVGNLWLAFLVVGQVSPAWMQAVFVGGTALIFLGGMGMAGLALRWFFEARSQERSDVIHDDKNSEDEKR